MPDIAHPFKWSDSTSLETEEEEMKAYENWNKDKEQAIYDWFVENGLNEENKRKIQFLYGDKYLYKKLEQYKNDGT